MQREFSERVGHEAHKRAGGICGRPASTVLLFCEDRPQQARGSSLIVDVDNTAMFDAHKRGSPKNTIMHEVVAEMFWLQVTKGFHSRDAAGAVEGRRRSQRLITAGSGRASSVRRGEICPEFWGWPGFGSQGTRKRDDLAVLFTLPLGRVRKR